MTYYVTYVLEYVNARQFIAIVTRSWVIPELSPHRYFLNMSKEMEIYNVPSQFVADIIPSSNSWLNKEKMKQLAQECHHRYKIRINIP
jgi:hypothetical protein